MCFGKKVYTIHEKKWWCWKNGVAAFVTDEMVCNLEHMPPLSLKIKTLLIHCIYLMYLQGTMETVRVVSMDKDFHVECYKCVVSTVCYKCRSQLL